MVTVKPKGGKIDPTKIFQNFVNSKKSTYSIVLKFYHVIKHKICRRLVPVASL